MARQACSHRGYATLRTGAMAVQRYDGVMKFAAPGLVRTLVLAAGACSGQIPQSPANPSHYLEIKLPHEVASERVWIRYLLAGEKFGGWVQPRPGVSSYVISTTRGERPATGIKALLYAPGCALQILNLPLSAPNGEQFSFICRPLPDVWITGRLTRSDHRYGREVKLQAKYVARWAQSFSGLGDEIIPDIPVGDVVYLPADGRFRLSVPDLSQDPLAGAPEYPSELQIWVKDKTSGDVVGLLIPAKPQAIKTRMGGLKIQSEYPSEIVFAPCRVEPSRLHDVFGFAIRPDPDDLCERR